MTNQNVEPKKSQKWNWNCVILRLAQAKQLILAQPEGEGGESRLLNGRQPIADGNQNKAR